MSLGFVVVLERHVEGIEPRDLDGRKLAARRHLLDAIAHEEDLPGLGEFVAFSQQEAETLAEDMKFDAPTVGKETGRWFDPARGLEVVRAIRRVLQESACEMEDAQEIDAHLEIMDRILSAAETEGVRFRLSLDY